jgi:asparagine synthase (glutamine-hydrolysing)
MCGLAGIVDLRAAAAPPSREALLRMAGTLQHRGPDEFGLYRDDRAGLAHARLSIIDLSTGQQPLSNEDGTLWIVFNGEIYNHVELRAQLEPLGHRFRTRSDTEAIVHAYEQWGETAFRHMEGQWALALWDARNRRLVLSRDPYGIAPLYLCHHRGRLYFASEVKAIFAAEGAIPRAWDAMGLEQTFTFWTPVAPQTVFSGIEELRPGHTRVYDERGMRDTPHAAPSYPERGRHSDCAWRNVEEAAQAVRAALENAVRLRVQRADVPVGSYLSGGLDSSLVAALGRRHTRGTFRTFSLRFEDAEYDETHYQRLMARTLGSEHHELTVRRRDVAESLPEVVAHAERPILRAGPAPLFLLSRLVHRAGIKVVLTGEGADEVFAGYDLFREAKVRRFWARFPESRLRPRALERLYPYLERSPVSKRALAREVFGRDLERAQDPGFGHAVRWRTTGALKRLFNDALRERVGGRNVIEEFLGTLPAGFTRWNGLARDQHIEIRTLLSGYLLSAQGDRMLMAHSVEGRYPYLDGALGRIGDALPAHYKLRALDEKHVLKRVARDLVPMEIRARHKQPYRAPDALALVANDRPAYIDELLSRASIAAAGIFDPDAVQRLWQKCRRAGDTAQFSNADNMALVGVVSAQLVHHHFIRERPTVRTVARLNTDIDCTSTPSTDSRHHARRRTVAT